MKTTTACTLGALLLAFIPVACGLAHARLPKASAEPWPDPTHVTHSAPPPAMAPTASALGFNEQLVPLTRMGAEVMGGSLSVGDRVCDLDPGEYLLYAEDPPYPDQGRWALRYASVDGNERGTLAQWESGPAIIFLGGTGENSRVMIAEISPSGMEVVVLGLCDGTARGLALNADAKWISFADVSSVRGPADRAWDAGFSPDGRWLVWDCPHNGAYGWCVLNLETGDSRLIDPGGGPLHQLGYEGFRPGSYVWFPDSGEFLALCTIDDTPESPQTWCVVEPSSGVVRRWKELTWPNGEAPPRELLVPHSVSPDGDWLLLSSWFQTGLMPAACVLAGACNGAATPLAPVGWYAWKPDGNGVAVSPFNPDREAKPTDVLVINPDTREVSPLMEFGPDDLIVRGWSPDGEWLALWSNAENPWKAYLLSRDGFLRGIVPMTNATYVGWVEVE